jgi:hypothetical protein
MISHWEGYSPGLATVAGDGRSRFTSVKGAPRQNLARLNRDGTLDNGFNPGADSEVESLAIQADGRIRLEGDFEMLAGEMRRSHRPVACRWHPRP